MSDTVTIIFRATDGTDYLVTGAVGSSAMLAAIENSVPGIEAECGGACICATCHVYVGDPGIALPEPHESEIEMLAATAVERRDNSRLSCQIRLVQELEGAVFHIPETQF